MFVVMVVFFDGYRRRSTLKDSRFSAQWFSPPVFFVQWRAASRMASFKFDRHV